MSTYLTDFEQHFRIKFRFRAGTLSNAFLVLKNNFA